MVRRRSPAAGHTKLRSARVAGFTLTEGIHAGGSSLPWHHHDGPTLCFVLQGAFTETSGGERLTCTPETLKVMPAGERHCDEFDRGDARGLLVETDAERAREIRTHAPVLDERVAFHGGVSAAIARRIYQEFRRMDDAAPLAIEGLVLELLAAISRQQKEALPAGIAPWIGQARDLLHADISSASHPGRAGRCGGGAPGDAGARVPRSFGCTRGRVPAPAPDRAGRRPAGVGRREPLAEIALAAGFADQSHFSNVFRRRTGMSPSAFRREAAAVARLRPAASAPAAARTGDRLGVGSSSGSTFR